MAVARRSWVRRVVPAIGLTLSLGVIALLALGALRVRRAGEEARRMAEHSVAGERALHDVERSVADVALAAAEKKAELPAARAQLERALEQYQPDSPGMEASWRDTRRRVLAFADQVTVDLGQAALIGLRMDGAMFALRGHSSACAARISRDVARLAAADRNAMFVELGLLLGVAGVCLALILRAAGREELAYAEEEAVMRQLERTNADLEAFAGRIAHDLRGPLSPILAGSQLIESSPVSTEVRRIAERIERSARRLFSMIDALLSFARLSGAPTPSAHAAIRRVVEDTLAGFSELAAQLRASFEVSVDTVAQVGCEPEIAALIVQNLVENALKYGLDGSADRVVEVRAHDEPRGVVIEVEDHGPGVPAHLGDRVFEPLIQGDDARCGVGLGLATVKRLAEARGGCVELHRGKRGALFRVVLPRLDDHAVAPAGV